MPIVQSATGLENIAYVIQVDPTVAGYQAPVGSLAYSTYTGTLYVKVGAALTAWTAVTARGNLGTYAFMSDEVDMVTPGTYNFPDWPAMPGHYVVQSSVRVICTNLAATTFATGPTVTIGNDATTYANLFSAANLSPSAAVMNTLLARGAGGPYLAGSSTTFDFGKLLDLTTTPKLKVTVAATGTAITQAKARYVFFCTVTNALVTV